MNNPAPIFEYTGGFDVYETLIDQRISPAQISELLGFKPPLEERERVTWLRFDEETGMGINALVATYTEADDEPYVASIAIYEQARSWVGEGVESHKHALIDFRADGEDWVVAEADVPTEWEEESIEQAIRRVRLLVQEWPYEREVFR